ncbi:MAG TPA: NADH-quinone oxidoreductase subunit L, partial [Cyanobacteria bacterium UBA12227]|nr:NADH-quinone oxidoreductase subunit L [Cyanobacteria bacterium UBA12227]
MDLTELLEIGQKERANRKSIRVRCCTAAACASSDSETLKKSLDDGLKQSGLENTVEICSVGCMKFCGRGPLVEIEPDGLLYQQVKPEQAPAIIAALKGTSINESNGLNPLDPKHPFFSLQQPIVLENSGKLDPERIEEYIAVGGYQQLYHVLHEMTPPEVVDEISKSGLRGRGGGGFPTGLKWATVAKMPGDQKYIICNADEGDP